MPAPTAEQLKAHYDRMSRSGEVVSRCKMWLPQLIEGLTVLDLGCRRGKGVYHIADRVGAHGKAIGLDWTPEFNEDARAHAAENVQFGEDGEPNMEFVVGYPEVTGLADDSVDVVVMNSVFNLACDPAAVLREAWRVLKPGGELYFAMVVTPYELPPEVRSRYLELGNSFGCAPSFKEYFDMFDAAGFTCRYVFDMAIPSKAPVDELNVLPTVEFYEGVVRSFKVTGYAAEDEERAAVAVYRGGEGMPDTFALEDGAAFACGEEVAVSANTARTLTQSRLAAFFDVRG